MLSARPTHDIVYNTNADVFYNDKYLDVLKERDYVLELNQIHTPDVIFDIIAKEANKEHKTHKTLTIVDEINKCVTLGRIISFANFKNSMSITKYMKRQASFDNLTISCNYVLQKYGKISANKKKILIIRDREYGPNDLFLRYGTLIDGKSEYFFDNSIECEIYSVFPSQLSDKYEKMIMNAQNGNKYYMIVDNRREFSMDDEFMTSLQHKLENKIFDIVYYGCSTHRSYLYLPLVLKVIDAHTHLLCEKHILEGDNVTDCVDILMPLFGKSMFIKDKFSCIAQPSVLIYYRQYAHNTRTFDALNTMINKVDVLMKKKVLFDITFNACDHVNIHKFFRKLHKKQLARTKLLLELLNCANTASDILAQTYLERIDIKQRAIAIKYSKYSTTNKQTVTYTHH